jgi:hypothetical protein
MNRYFRLYRDSMKRLSKMDTILEEVYVTDKEPGPVLDDWKKTWHAARDESHWDQWVDIEYIDVYAEEPSTSPPPMYKVTTKVTTIR